MRFFRPPPGTGGRRHRPGRSAGRRRAPGAARRGPFPPAGAAPCPCSGRRGPPRGRACSRRSGAGRPAVVADAGARPSAGRAPPNPQRRGLVRAAAPIRRAGEEVGAAGRAGARAGRSWRLRSGKVGAFASPRKRARAAHARRRASWVSSRRSSTGAERALMAKKRLSSPPPGRAPACVASVVQIASDCMGRLRTTSRAATRRTCISCAGDELRRSAQSDDRGEPDDARRRPSRRGVRPYVPRGHQAPYQC